MRICTPVARIFKSIHNLRVLVFLKSDDILLCPQDVVHTELSTRPVVPTQNFLLCPQRTESDISQAQSSGCEASCSDPGTMQPPQPPSPCSPPLGPMHHLPRGVLRHHAAYVQAPSPGCRAGRLLSQRPSAWSRRRTACSSSSATPLLNPSVAHAFIPYNICQSTLAQSCDPGNNAQKQPQLLL